MQTPTQQGQICQILTPMADENPSDVYIIAEDPSPFDLDDDIYIVNLRDLQRNINNPSITSQFPVPKSELNVIAENLEDYVKSWNS
jgi:hypothetical protein